MSDTSNIEESKEKLTNLAINVDGRAVEGLHRYFTSTIDHFDQNDPYREDILKFIVTLENIKTKFECQ